MLYSQDLASHPDGHDVWGRGGAGFPIVLTLILRPSLIVVGFFVGVSFNWVVGHWINVTIIPAHNIQNGDVGFLPHFTRIGGLLLVFSGLHLFAVYKSFSLTWELPNAILRWMGIQDHQDLGEREGKDNIMALGMPGGRAMSPSSLPGNRKKDVKPDDKDETDKEDPNGTGGGDNNGGGQTDPNTSSTPPGAGPAGTPGEGASGKPKGVD